MGGGRGGVERSKNSLHNITEFHQLVEKFADEAYEFSHLKNAIPIEFDAKIPLLKYSLKPPQDKESIRKNIEEALQKIHPNFKVLYEREAIKAANVKSYQEEYRDNKNQEIEELKQSEIVKEVFKHFPNSKFV